MRRFFSVLALVAAVLLYAASARDRDISLRKLATVELNRDSLAQNDSMRTVEIVGSRRQSFGSFQSIRLYDIVAVLPEIKDVQPTSLTVVCESSDGQMCTMSLTDLDPAFVKLPPLLLISPNEGREKSLDSFALSDKKGGARGKVDLTALEDRFSRVTRLRYTLNDVELSAEEHRRLLAENMRLLFPYDRLSARWLPNIKFIHVYVAE